MKDLWHKLPDAVRIAVVMVAIGAAIPLGIGGLIWCWAWGVKIVTLLPWPTGLPCSVGGPC